MNPHPESPPVYLKLEPDWVWPVHESMFYLLCRDGLFLCRNHPFFRSCVPARARARALAGQRPFLQLNFPRIPQPLLELVVGFFDIIARRHQAEAAVLVLWNQETRAVELFVPPQVAVVGGTPPHQAYPLQVHYALPVLPPHRLLIGDIHSHVNLAAFASHLDRADEAHSPGLHLVVGRIEEEPPEFHCEVVADGMRFRVTDLTLVLEGYQCRRSTEVPAQWLEQVAVRTASDDDGRGDSWLAIPGTETISPALAAGHVVSAERSVPAPAEGEAVLFRGNEDAFEPTPAGTEAYPHPNPTQSEPPSLQS